MIESRDRLVGRRHLMLAFITVGSTKFDALVQAAESEEILNALRNKGYTNVIIQCGNSAFKLGNNLAREQTRYVELHGVELEIWRFKPTLQDAFEGADLIISHAGADRSLYPTFWLTHSGSGTILDVLRLGKPLIVVPNPTLLDNHQEELAESLSSLGHLKSSSVA